MSYDASFLRYLIKNCQFCQVLIFFYHCKRKFWRICISDGLHEYLYFGQYKNVQKGRDSPIPKCNLGKVQMKSANVHSCHFMTVATVSFQCMMCSKGYGICWFYIYLCNPLSYYIFSYSDFWCRYNVIGQALALHIKTPKFCKRIRGSYSFIVNFMIFPFSLLFYAVFWD
jgi:hypothetical protein